MANKTMHHVIIGDDTYEIVDQYAREYGGGGGGQPKATTLAAHMVDEEQMYLYLGSETGYSYGYIYAYINGAWTATTLYGVGQPGQDGTDGQDGVDGYSPVATVTQTETGAAITVTDKNGTTTATVQNGAATDEQVAAWLDNHPEATTTVEDGAISEAKLADGAVTPNKTSFIEEPWFYDVHKVSYGTGNSEIIPIDLDTNTYVCVAVPTSTTGTAVKDRRLFMYLGDTYVGYVSGSVNTGPDSLDGWTIKYFNITSYTSAQVDGFQIQTTTAASGGFAYWTFDTPAAYTPAELFKTVFGFRTGYKDKFSEALELGTPGSVTEESISDGAVTQDKIADQAVAPWKIKKSSVNLINYDTASSSSSYIGGNGQLLGTPDFTGVKWNSTQPFLTSLIPVVPGESYVLNFVPDAFRLYAWYANADGTGVIGNTAYLVAQSSDPYELTAPAGANYLRLCARNTTYVFNYPHQLWMLMRKADYEAGITEICSFPWLKLSDRNRMLSSPFYGKTLIATGDSITEANSKTAKNWHHYVKETLGFAKDYNDGKSGTGFVKRYQSLKPLWQRIETAWTTDFAGVTPDVILINGNMNDGTGAGELNSYVGYDGNSVGGMSVLPVGTESDDTNTLTVYGVTKRILNDLITMYPHAKIGVIASTPRYTSHATLWPNKPNDYGHGWFDDYITAIKYSCEQYDVPFLDLYHNNELRPWNATCLAEYFQPDGAQASGSETPDGVHPNSIGHELMAKKIIPWMLEYLQ